MWALLDRIFVRQRSENQGAVSDVDAAQPPMCFDPYALNCVFQAVGVLRRSGGIWQ